HPRISLPAVRDTGHRHIAVPSRRPASTLHPELFSWAKQSMSTPLLTACDLTVRFDGLTALDALNLTVYEGEVMGLLGPNGSGKTTFFNVVTGLYTAASGRIMLGSEDISTKSPQEVYGHGVTRTFQRSRLSLSLTVFDNMVIGNYQHLNTGLFFNLFSRAQMKRQYDEMVDKAHTLLNTFN